MGHGANEKAAKNLGHFFGEIVRRKTEQQQQQRKKSRDEQETTATKP